MIQCLHEVRKCILMQYNITFKENKKKDENLKERKKNDLGIRQLIR